jgi:hypothetical protein
LVENQTQYFDLGGAMRRLEFFRNNLKPILIWPAVALLLGIALWSFTLYKLEQGKKETKEGVYLRAMSLTSAYVAQLTQTLERIDQVTLLVRHEWKKRNSQIQLEKYAEEEIFPRKKFHVVAVNQDGKIISTTWPEIKSIKYTEKSWFQAHKTNPSNEVQFHGEEISAITGKPIIRFSRRLETPDGRFDGVTWVVVEPPFLTTFYEGRDLSEGEFISLRIKDGPVLVTKSGGEPRTAPFYLQHPTFPAPEGVIEEPGTKFRDNESRVVAWEKIAAY